MALKNAPRVGIHNKDGGFWADAVNSEELQPQGGGGSAEHRGERAAMFFSEKRYERLEFAGFLAEIARGTDEAGEFGLGNQVDGGGSEEFGVAEIGDGAGGVNPGGVLDEDGADDDFEGGAAGPPVLLALGVKERIKILGQDG